MTKAIHLISRREGTGYVGLSRWDGTPHGYRSCCWMLTDKQAAELLGGWVYFHEAKAAPSGFGGQILGFEPGTDDMAGRKAILFRVDTNTRGKTWRGSDHGMAYMSGVIEADLSHEAEQV